MLLGNSSSGKAAMLFDYETLFSASIVGRESQSVIISVAKLLDAYTVVRPLGTRHLGFA